MIPDLTFPQELPKGYSLLADEPVFDPDRHLQLEMPEQVFSLQEFGYDAQTGLNDAPVDFAATSVFRVLSDEGVHALYQVTKLLEPFTTSNPRIARNVRGGAYRSKFLRDLCLSSEIADFMSKIAGIELVPHRIFHQLGHLNFNPKEVGENVDKWHVDTLRFDYVLFVTDPTKNEGGEFQYFKGTKQAMADLKAKGEAVPKAQVISPAMPGPGYAVLQQGNYVVHQAKGLTKAGERITMVNGYIPKDPMIKDYTRFDQLCHVDPEDVVATEFSRHYAVQAAQLLEQSIIHDSFGKDHLSKAEKLETVANLLLEAAGQIRNGKGEIEHFGD